MGTRAAASGGSARTRRTVLVAGIALVLIAAAVGAWLVLGGGQATVPSVGDAAPAPAGGTGGVGVVPVRSLVPSDETDTTIDYAVSNAGDQPRTYALTVGELSADGKSLPDDARSAARWVTLTTTSLDVAPGDTARFPVRIQPPADRGADERRIALVVTDVTEQSGSGVQLRTAISTSIYVAGIGVEIRGATLSHLALPWLSGEDLAVTAELTNDGNVIVVPGATQGTILGTTSSGETFPLSGAVARPGETVSVAGVTRLPAICWCEVRVTAPDGADGVTTVSGRVLVLPWPWVIAAAVALVVALVLLVVVRARRSSHPSGRRRPDAGTPSP
jgi:hypothetical protein